MNDQSEKNAGEQSPDEAPTHDSLAPAQIQNLLNRTAWQSEKLPPQEGGLITPKCVKCGGEVFSSGGGLVSEICSHCGETHEESLLRDAGA